MPIMSHSSHTLSESQQLAACWDLLLLLLLLLLLSRCLLLRFGVTAATAALQRVVTPLMQAARAFLWLCGLCAPI
jgi:hypothetical protein